MHVSEKGKYRAQMYEWNGHDWNDYVAAVHLRLSLLRHHQWPVSERRQTQTNNKLKIGRERERERKKESGMLEHRSIPEPSQTRAAPLGFKGSGGSLLQIPFCAWHKHAFKDLLVMKTFCAVVFTITLVTKSHWLCLRPQEGKIEIFKKTNFRSGPWKG